MHTTDLRGPAKLSSVHPVSLRDSCVGVAARLIAGFPCVLRLQWMPRQGRAFDISALRYDASSPPPITALKLLADAVEEGDSERLRVVPSAAGGLLYPLSFFPVSRC